MGSRSIKFNEPRVSCVKVSKTFLYILGIYFLKLISRDLMNDGSKLFVNCRLVVVKTYGQVGRKKRLANDNFE